jgi:hypothetical protein
MDSGPSTLERSRTTSPEMTKLIHRRKNLLFKRTSSFGAAPLVIKKREEPAAVSSVRWLILILTCLLLFGNYYGTLLKTHVSL